jgi:N12 class adenine-specific DNA methylase
MDTVAILSFISVVVLATVTFIFMSNTRKRMVELKQDVNRNKLIMQNNLSKIANDYNFNDTILKENTDNLEQKYSNIFNDNDTNISINKPLKVNNMIEICDNQGNNCKQVITNNDQITLRSEKDGMRLQNNNKNGKFINANRQLWEKIRIEKCGVPSYGDGKNCS